MQRIPTRTVSDNTYTLTLAAAHQPRPKGRPLPRAVAVNIHGDVEHIDGNRWRVRANSLSPRPMAVEDVMVALSGYGFWTPEELAGAELALETQKAGFALQMDEPVNMPDYQPVGVRGHRNALDNNVPGWEPVEGRDFASIQDFFYYRDGACHIMLRADMHIGRVEQSMREAYAVLKNHCRM